MVVSDKQKELEEGIARAICPFYPGEPEECERCEEKGDCPQWDDIKEQRDKLISLLADMGYGHLLDGCICIAKPFYVEKYEFIPIVKPEKEE